MKIMMKIILIVFAVLVVFNLVKNGIVQAGIGTVLSKASRVPVKVSGTNMSFMASSLSLRGIRFYNPRNFPEKLMIEIDQVFISLDPWGLFRGQAHLKQVKLNLKEVIVIKNKAGEININAMKPERKGKTPAREGKQMQVKIDRLNLSIGRVVYKDYSQGSEPQIQVFDINIQNREYRNIDNPSAVVSLITFEALTRTSLSRLAGMDLSFFKQDFSQSLDLVTGSAGDVTETAKGILNIFK